MAIPNNIQKEHLLSAIERIDKEGVPVNADSQYYDVVYNGKFYPPKLIVSIANYFANGIELDRNSFSGGINTPCFKLLERNNFIIKVKKDMGITRELVVEIIELCEKMAIGRESNEITPSTYSNTFKPKLAKFKNKYNESPNVILQNELKLFYNMNKGLGAPGLKMKNFGFWGRSIYNYIWTCLYYDFGRGEMPASYSPQLYILINRFGLKFGFCYGHHISNESDLVNIINQPKVIGLLRKAMLNDKSLSFFNTTDFEVTARPETLFGEKDRIMVESNEDIVKNWNRNSLLIREFSKGSLPENVGDVIFKTLNNLKEFYFSLLPSMEVNDYNSSVSEIFSVSDFKAELLKANLTFQDILPCRFVASLITKPFVLLTGLSGSGKTKLAQAFVQWISQDKSQYRIIPVGADWTNREPLLGYPNALNPSEYVKPDSGVLDLIIQANDRPNLPHFLVLDEMNLSHVERYFADFLSVMESKEEIALHSIGKIENGVPARLKFPSNLFIIGTVNIDETTNMFSPKVLDRANTIEFRVTKSEMEEFLGNIKDINMDALTGRGAGMAKSFLEMAGSRDFATADITEINSALVQFFSELKRTGAEFGYRSATEILRLIYQLTVLDSSLTTDQKIDIAIMQKLLPKLHGSRRKLCPVLETLGSFCIIGDVKIIKDVFERSDFDYTGTNVRYPLSLEKIARIYRGAIDNGFASFAEA